MCTNHSVKCNWIISALLILSIACNGQIAHISDVISGNFSSIGDFQVNDPSQIFYIVDRAKDSISINGNWVSLKSFPDSSYSGDSYFFATNGNDNIDFLIDIGRGSKLITLDSSVFLFDSFGADTFFITDTFFVKSGPENSDNLIALQYDLQGNYLNGKHWPSPYNCRYGVSDVCATDKMLFITGSYDRDTLQFDNQKAGEFNKEDVFIAAFDNSLVCNWLTRLGHNDIELPQSIDVDFKNRVLTAGYFSSGLFQACDETLTNPYGWANADAFISILDSTGDCKWTEGVHGSASQSIWSAKYLSDESVVVAGHHWGDADFGDTVLIGPAQTLNGFIAKYNQYGALEFALQLEGDVTQNITDMVVTPDDNIWVCGSYFSNPMVIGGIELYVRGDGGSDAYVAKFDKNGNVLYAQSFGGNDNDICLKLENGSGNSVFAIMNTKSDIVDVGDEILELNSDLTNNIIIKIDDTTTSVETLNPSIPDIQIYPNPVGARNQILIDFDQTRIEGLQRITLLHLNGQVINVVESFDHIPIVLQIPDIPSGVYILNFDFGSVQISKKIVVVR